MRKFTIWASLEIEVEEDRENERKKHKEIIGEINWNHIKKNAKEKEIRDQGNAILGFIKREITRAYERKENQYKEADDDPVVPKMSIQGNRIFGMPCEEENIGIQKVYAEKMEEIGSYKMEIYH
jgi:hypothetical protein